MMFLHFYRFVFTCVKFTFFLFSPILPKALKAWFRLRKQAGQKLDEFAIPQNDTFQKSIWFHAASGEIEYVKGIIREIKSTAPQQKIVLTYSSISAERLLFNIQNEIDLILPLTWDDCKSIQKLIRVINPQLLVFAKTDFWPELIHQVEKKKISMSVVSFTLLGRNKLNPLTSWALPKMKMVLCADTATQELLNMYNIKSEVFGDTRFDQVFFRLSNEPRIQLKNPTAQPILVLASTWPADDHVLLSCTPKLIQKGLKIIWCPHDVGSERVNELAQNILKSGSFTVKKLSEFTSDQIELTSQILIVDRIGFLADVYRYSTFAFVGGSFERRVHSVMEPLCAGNMVFVGPHYKNNLEAVEFSKIGLVHVVRNAEEFVSHLSRLEAPTLAKMKNEILKLCNEKRGAAKKIAQNLLRAVTISH